ncbi:MAG: PQQ-dependent sugar dehydrogenase [Terrimicrobiaceae bacterium]
MRARRLSFRLVQLAKYSSLSQLPLAVIPRAILAILVFAASSCLSPADEVIRSEKASFRPEVVVEGLKNPWGMVFLPNGRLLVTERPGALRIVENGQLLPEPVKGIPEVFAVGQGGLLDIELHPNHASNGWIYLAYSEPKPGGGMTKIVRGRLEGNTWVDQQTIFEAPEEEYSKGGVHFGIRMEFDKDNKLFFTIGDRGDNTTPENNAQKLTNAKGKCHRINDDGSIPVDNPFAGTPGHTASIWTYGNRNIQGLRFDPSTGLLWASEHGPRGGDELNILSKGANYGWPVVSYGINYNGTSFTERTEAPGITPPALQWTPSIAVAGIEFYTGNDFPGWKGNLFAAALAHQKLVRIEIAPDNTITHQEILLEKSGRMRDVRMSPDGYLHIVYDDPGKIVRLLPET